MFSIEGNTINITKGDTGIITLTLDNHYLNTGDTVYMTVKKNINDVNTAFSITLTIFEEGKANIKLTSQLTNITPGKYVYDIQINLADGRIQTVIQPSVFKILKGVTENV